MNKKLKIAIYSGTIPSTTFIERLICGLSDNNCRLYLFGAINKKSKYGSFVTVSGYFNSKYSKILATEKPLANI